MAQKANLFLLTALQCLGLSHLVVGHVITSAPLVRFTEPASLNLEELQGNIPNQWLGRRGETDCDGVGIFTCPTGTCYTGGDGFIGCCSVSSCAPRTTCIDYHGSGHSDECDIDTGGCIACSKEAPACVRIINVLEDQYIMYCDRRAKTQTTSYTNLRMDSPTVSPSPTTSTAASSTSTSMAAISTVTVEIKPEQPSSTSTMTMTSSLSTPTAASATGTQLSPGAITGIAIAAVVCTAIISALIFFFVFLPWRRHRQEISNAGGFSNDKHSAGPKSPPLWGSPFWAKRALAKPSDNTGTGLGISSQAGEQRGGVRTKSPEPPGTPGSAELPSEIDSDSPRQTIYPHNAATAYQPMPTMVEESSSTYPIVAPQLRQPFQPQSLPRPQTASSQYVAWNPHHHSSLPASELSTPASSMLGVNRPSTLFSMDNGLGNANNTGNVNNAVGDANKKNNAHNGGGERVQGVGERGHRVSATGGEGRYMTPETAMADGWIDVEPKIVNGVVRK